jgi:CO/xanthine dehydrogenase FAD-binding subunit
MIPFTYARATDAGHALQLVSRPGAKYWAAAPISWT